MEVVVINLSSLPLAPPLHYLLLTPFLTYLLPHTITYLLYCSFTYLLPHTFTYILPCSFTYLLPLSFLNAPPYLLRLPSMSVISGMKLANIACKWKETMSSCEKHIIMKKTRDANEEVFNGHKHITSHTCKPPGWRRLEIRMKNCSMGKAPMHPGWRRLEIRMKNCSMGIST